MTDDDICTEGQDGLVLFCMCFIVPLIGCVLAVVFQSIWWLVLLAPLIVFMEGGLFLIGLAVIIVSWIIGG